MRRKLGKENAIFAPFYTLYLKMRIFQDRLGTNIGKVETRVAFSAG